MTDVRCAIYTRKSSDEGLELEFNSLDAQHEACAAYVASQRHEGWTLVGARYDDGGYSGGSMDRPALQRLLADVAAGRIDVILVYKIDRLTRSLTDFAKIVEVVENAGTSFVSVTQSFNTKTSMGRLMLHVLLSFAQFEREVGAERIRDKIAASKAKGMWMGGTVPLGYDAIDRKLVINAEEADTVRRLFRHYLELGSVSALLEWSQGQALRTKRRIRLGSSVGGECFSYGALRYLLANRTYAGETSHKGNVFPGQHEAIIDPELFRAVQCRLAERGELTAGPKLTSTSLLMGIIFDCHGRRMGPTHTKRKGQRYRYYATHRKCIERGGPAPLRLPAHELERHCINALVEHLRKRHFSEIEEHIAIQERINLLLEGPLLQRIDLLRTLVIRVEVGQGLLVIHLADGQCLKCSIARVRHGNDTALVIREPHAKAPPLDAQLIKLISDAYRARMLAIKKPMASLEELAREFGRSPGRYQRLLRLSYLAPTVVESIMSGSHPQSLTGKRLQHLNGLPLLWAEQEKVLLR